MHNFVLGLRNYKKTKKTTRNASKKLTRRTPRTPAPRKSAPRKSASRKSASRKSSPRKTISRFVSAPQINFSNDVRKWLQTLNLVYINYSV